MIRKRVQKNRQLTKEAKVTFTKRKRGLLKKSIELSTLCDKKVFIVIYDDVNKILIEFNSHDEFNIEAAINAKRLEKEVQYQKFTNADLTLLEQNLTPYQTL